MAAGVGGGVSIPVGANTGQATQQINKLQQQLGKFGGAVKGLFGGQSAQQAATYNKHLQQLERNLERVTMRVKSLQGAQAQLLQQQKQLQAGGVSLTRQDPLFKAIQQNQRSLTFWQGKQMGAQAQLTTMQGNRPSVGGGGGGTAQFLAGQFQNVAGGIGGTLLKALGIGAITGGLAAVASKAFLTAADEQKLLADLLPRMRTPDQLLNRTSPKGYMNNFRNLTMPYGYSGVEGLKIAEALAPGTNDRGLQRDTQTAMQMARMFGLDAGGQASMLGEAGKMGAFRPGDARKFAEMLAREIGKNNPRAQEVQEATLTLLHRQMAMSGTTAPAAAMALQTSLARTGIPGLQGQFGANVIGQMESHFGGATDDASVAFTEAMLRDQRGVRGYYATRRAKENIQAGKDPYFFRDAVREAYQISPHESAAKDLLSSRLGIPMILLDEIGRHTSGGLRNFKGVNPKGFTMGGDLLGPGSAAAMSLTGNQFRKGEATVSGLLARGGTPMVQGIGTLVDKASTQIQKLLLIEDHTKTMAEGFFGKDAARFTPGHLATVPDGKGGYKQSGTEKYFLNPLGRKLSNAWDWFTDQGAYSKHNRKPPVLPLPGGGPPTAAQMGRAAAGHLIHPAHVPHPIQRGSADNELHLHVHFDQHGAIHPHVKLAFEGMVEEALGNIQRRHVKSDTHLRYPRA